jgi:hypothetical protein
MAQERICSACTPVLPGDFVHRSSGFDSAFVGHAGIHAGGYRYYHVTSKGSDIETALQKVGFITFFSSSEGDYRDNWGAKRPASRPNGISSAEFGTVERTTQDFMEIGVKYDTFHVNQKGKFFAQDARDPKYFEDGHFKFDCVGYVEGIFENPRRGLNINLTPNDQEEGIGLPLTVREQRDSPWVVNVPPS